MLFLVICIGCLLMSIEDKKERNGYFLAFLGWGMTVLLQLVRILEE